MGYVYTPPLLAGLLFLHSNHIYAYGWVQGDPIPIDDALHAFLTS